MPSLPLTARAEQLARHAAAFLGFSIPISVALDNGLLALVALLWLAGGDLKRKFADIAANPVALAALALFGMMAAGLLYGERDSGAGLRYLGKYVDLLFIPILVTLFHDARTREAALRWFCAAMVVTFVAAEVTALGYLEGNPFMARGAEFPGAFKSSITHGLLAAFAAFAFARMARDAGRGSQQLLFGVLALVAIKNVFFVAISRTAYLVLVLLALYYCFALFRTRGLAIACLLIAALGTVSYGSSETFRQRVDTIVFESGDWQPRWASRESVTVRVEWYQHSFDIVKEHPLLGVGTGSFPKVLAERKTEGVIVNPPNPHNEYLAIAMQTGLVGLVLLLHLFWRQWALAPRLASPLETHLARGLVITLAVGCLFNSFLLDHTEGLFYAWFTGLLFGGLRAPPPRPGDPAP
jgi:O-antigen ligase